MLMVNALLNVRVGEDQNSLNTAEIAANPNVSATNRRQMWAGILPKDFAPSQLPNNNGGNNINDSKSSRQLARPSARDEIVPAIAVAKKTSNIDARASAGGIGWRK